MPLNIQTSIFHRKEQLELTQNIQELMTRWMTFIGTLISLNMAWEEQLGILLRKLEMVI